MPLLFFYVLLFFYATALSAQQQLSPQELVDSSEFLIYEDMDLVTAKRLNEKAQQDFKIQNNLEGLAHCRINDATIWAQKDSFQKSLLLLNKISKKLPASLFPDSRLLGLFYTSKAWALWGAADYQLAYEHAVQACRILSKQKDWKRYVNASLIATYAIYYNNESDFSRIDIHMDSTYQTALNYLPNSSLAFKYIYQLYGSILYQQGRIEKAIHITHQGLDYEYQLLLKNHQKKDSSIVAKYYSNLGRMYSENEDVEQGIVYYKNAFILYERLKNYAELIKLCTRIGTLYEKKEKRNESDLFFGKIPEYIPFLSKDPIIQLRENSFEHLSMAYYYNHFNFNDSILDYYNKNIAYIEQHQLGVDKAYINIGSALEALGKYKKAKIYYLKTLALAKQKYGNQGTKVASIYFKIGHLAAEEGQHQKAISYMDSVLLLLDESPESSTDKILLLEYLLDKSIAIEAYQKRGDAFIKKGELHKAHNDFNNIILLANYLRDHYIDSESKLLSINRLRPVYEKAAATAWHLYKEQQNKAYEMSIFDYAEHSKSALLNENILKFRNNYKEGGTGISKELLQKEETYIVQIDQCKEHILEAKKEQNKEKEASYLQKMLLLEQELDAFEQHLQEIYPSYRSWDHGRDSIVSPKEVQAHLAADELFIEYFISENHFFVIYISKDVIKIKELQNLDTDVFNGKIQNLRRSLSNVTFILKQEKEAYKLFCNSAHWLYQNILEDPLLKDKKHLIIVPDRSLHYIPFEVLLTKLPNTERIDYQTLPYLIQDYAIHYEYSAAIMVNNQRKVNTTNGKILGFAANYGKQFDHEKFPKALQKERSPEETHTHNSAAPIPGTITELEQIEQRFKGAFYTHEAANEHNFKQQLKHQNYSVVHLAMHGLVDYNHPAYSALLFTENLDSLEDNLLYSYETQHLNGNNANLVVLSACKTGYGKYAQGEGIISLGRSFMYAGIPSIVMTLWELNDETSVEVVQSFYTGLANGLTKDQAMQNAKIEYLQNNKGFTAHPFFWASMICIGDQQAIPLSQKSLGWYWYLLGLVSFLFLLLIIRSRRKASV
jgi:CHAT domain-containing protein/tetratricopeptide (TPR) repeat protein